MTAAILAKVAAMPLPPVDIGADVGWFTAGQLRAARMEAAELVLSQQPSCPHIRSSGPADRAVHWCSLNQQSVNAEMLAALREVLRISDRKHVAWDTVKAWVASAEAAGKEAT